MEIKNHYHKRRYTFMTVKHDDKYYFDNYCAKEIGQHRFRCPNGFFKSYKSIPETKDSVWECIIPNKTDYYETDNFIYSKSIYFIKKHEN